MEDFRFASLVEYFPRVDDDAHLYNVKPSK